MRLAALLPVALCAASLVLTFLCLFAGHSKGFMEDYAILTLNTSRIGQNLFNTTETSDNPLVNFFLNLTNTVEQEIEDGIASIAKELGLHDFYSAHLMDYCEGYYTPGPVPNSTLKKSDIDKNVTSCSNQTVLYNFDPQQILQRELDESGHSNIDLVDNLDWPDDIDKGLQALRAAFKAMFILYCIACGFIAIGLIAAVITIFFDGRLSAFLNVVIDLLAFAVVGVASAIATAIAVKGSDVVNKYGRIIGVSANQGNGFLTLTWIATGLVLLSSIAWCFDCIAGRRRRSYGDGPKYG